MKTQEISEYIHKLRKGKGIKQEKLAEILKVSRQTISNWETGKTIPTTENVEAMSKYFNVPFSSFGVVEEEEEKISELEIIRIFKRNYKLLLVILIIISIIEFILMFIGGMIFGSYYHDDFYDDGIINNVQYYSRFYIVLIFITLDLIAFIVVTILILRLHKKITKKEI